MNRPQRDYANGKIYMIESLQGDVRYIGSTCGELQRRMCGHKGAYKSWSEGKGRISSMEVLAHPDARIVLIEDFPCETWEQLVEREAHHIRNTTCVNRNIPGRTAAAYYQDNREAQIAKAMRHHVANRELKLEQMKQYYYANRDQQLANMKQYRIDNREAMNRKEACPICGSIVAARNMTRHRQSEKHIAAAAIDRLRNADDEQDMPIQEGHLVADIAAV